MSLVHRISHDDSWVKGVVFVAELSVKFGLFWVKSGNFIRSSAIPTHFMSYDRNATFDFMRGFIFISQFEQKSCLAKC
jgi:hypothetical protein